MIVLISGMIGGWQIFEHRLAVLEEWQVAVTQELKAEKHNTLMTLGEIAGTVREIRTNQKWIMKASDKTLGNGNPRRQ